MLVLQVHKGEAEAIALAADLTADVVIIHEQEGRGLATQARLYVTGTLGVLSPKPSPRGCKTRDSSLA
jgi:predicted nucleic acid-binding protein